MKKAIYAGSFDPLTLGHLDIIKRALKITDYLIIGVGENIRKKYLFSLQERINMINETLKSIPVKNFEVKAFEGLLVDFAKKEKAQCIVRGLRALTDFDYEFQIGLTNKELNGDVETIFLLTSKENIFISSSMVKELAYFKKDISNYVPVSVLKAFENKFSR